MCSLKKIAQLHLGYQENNIFKCYVYGDPFIRQFSLKRHMKWKHAQSNVESKKENPKIHNFTENGLKLRHPFTMMVAASTGGGRPGLSKTESSGFPLHHSESYGSMVSGNPCMQKCRESYQT